MGFQLKMLSAVTLLLTGTLAFAQPTNDNCSGAIALLPSNTSACDVSVAGTTADASYTGLYNNCGAPYKDVWYRFTATQTAHTIYLSGVQTDGNPTYFAIELFTGTCDSLRHLICSPWNYQEAGFSVGDLTPDSTYFIRVLSPYEQTLDFNICVRTPPAPPANDGCAGAIALTPDPDQSCSNPVSGTTHGATHTPLVPYGCCGTPDDDVWYKFTATSVNHQLIFQNIAGIDGANPTYAEVQVLNGSCGQFSQMTSEYYYQSGATYLSNLTVGQTYYFRVYSYTNLGAVTFDVCVITPAKPSYDECADAFPVDPSTGLNCEVSFAGSLYGATVSRPDCSGDAASDVWARFTATSPSHYINVNQVSYSNGFGVEVLGGDCNNLSTLACQEGSYNNLLVQNLSVGADYYIRVFTGPHSAATFNGCILTLPPPPANDECSGALPVPVNSGYECTNLVSGSTLGATGSAPDCNGNPDHDVWYSFVATSAQHRIEISLLNGYLSNYYGLGYEVYAGDCNGLVSLKCVPYYNNPAVLAGLTPGNTYFIRLFSQQGSGHDFSLCIQTLPPPPANAACANALEITPSGGLSCTPESGSTEGVSENTQGLCNYFGMSVWYRFVATTAMHVLRMTDIQTLYGGYGNLWAELYTGNCDTLQLTVNQCYNYQNETFLQNLSPGTTYYLRVSSTPNTGVKFNICLGSVPIPPNDACSQATALPTDPDLVCDAATPGTTAGATYIPSNSLCYSNGPDVWYSFTATQPVHHISLTDIANFETNNYYTSARVELLTNNCDSLVHLQCYSTNYNSDVIVAGDLIPGQTYYIRVLGNYEPLINFNICILTPPPPPANDRCEDASILTASPGNQCDAPTAGTTLHASLSNGYCCVGQIDVWYTFTATQPNHRVIVSDVYNALYNGYPEYALVEVYTTSCGNGSPEVQSSFYGYGNVYLSHLIPGSVYRIRITSNTSSYSPGINFNICVTTPEAPGNDDCTGAFPLPTNPDLNCSTVLETSTLGSTQSKPDCDGAQANDTWYQFVAAASSYRFDITANSITGGLAGFEFLTGDCNGLTSLRCEQINYAQAFTLSGLTQGNTYYLRLFSSRNNYHTITVCARQLPEPPANDECAGAQAITINPGLICDVNIYGSTLGATQSLLSCNGYTTQDVWYAFTATSTAHRIEAAVTNGYFGSYSDFGLQVYSGTCDNLQSLLCQEFIYGTGFTLNGLIPGNTYYIRVSSFNSNAHDFSLCLLTLPPPPPNDNCATATPLAPSQGLTCDQSYAGTTLSATSELYPDGPPDVWYSFIATSNSHILDVSNTQPVFGYSNYLYVELYQGTCGNLTQIGGYSAYSANFLYNLTPGQQYFVRIYTYSSNNAYNFNLCLKTLPPSPPNENCDGAIEVVPNTGQDCTQSTPGTTAGAINQSYYSCGYGNDVWYKFTAISQAHLIQLNNLTAVIGNGTLWLEVLQGNNCENFYTLYCQSSYYQPAFLQGLTSGQTYYLHITAEPGSVFSFDLCIQTLQSPANDDCTGATPLPVSPDYTCASSVPISTLGASASSQSSCSSPANDTWYSFTATQSAHSISVNNVFNALDHNYYGSFGIEVYAGNCDNPATVYCTHYQNFSLNLILGDLTPGQTYFIRLISYNNFITGEICIATPPPPPANDVCANAQTLPVDADNTCDNSTSGTTQFATPSTALSYNGYYYNNGNDVWYQFTALQANHVVQLRNIGYPNFGYGPLLLELLDGSCGTFSSLAQQEFNGNGDMLLTHLVPGHLYYLRVVDYYNNAITFDLCITSIPAPANDNCANATPLDMNPDLFCVYVNNGTTYGATQSQAGCSGTPANDVWFTFVAASPTQRLDFSSVNTNGSTFGVEVLSGDCDHLTPVLSCTEMYYSGVLTVQNLTLDQTYYVRVYTPRNTYLQFNLCVRTLPPPPSNDHCAGAKPLSVSGTLDCNPLNAGSTLGATGSGTTCNGLPAHDVWYQFTATSTAHIIEVAETATLLENYGPLGFEVYAGDCNNLTPLQCAEYAQYSPISLNNLSIGASYYVRVFSVLHTAHEFTICIRTLPPPPANDLCANAQEIQPTPGPECTGGTPGTTAGLTEATYSGCYYGPDVWYTFVATSSIHQIRLTDIQSIYGYGALSYELYHGSSCDQLVLLNCMGGYDYLYGTNFVPGDTYYIRVIGGQNAAANFNLCVLAIAPPPNDACANAITVPVSDSETCSNTVSGTTFGSSPSDPPGYCFSNNNDVWFTFVATAAEHILHVNSSQNNNSNIYAEVFGGACGNLTLVGCFYLYNPPLIANLIPGETYWIRISSYTVFHTFDICVATAKPDLGGSYIYPNSSGCGAGTDESVSLAFYNYGTATIPAGAAQITLEVSGTNSGMYGPVTNDSPIAPGNFYSLQFYHVNLSNPGFSLLVAKGIVPGDSKPANDSMYAGFTTLTMSTFYADNDGDGYGNPDAPLQACFQPGGYVTDHSDCNDFTAAVFPGATEICDSLDNDCNGILDDCVSIGGSILWERNDMPVKAANVTLAGDATGTYATGAAGAYIFSGLLPGNYTITPAKNTNPLNGVTVADANIVRRMALGQQVTTDPYVRIAADVNTSSAITMADYTLMTQALKGNPNNGPTINPSWRFVPTAYVFPNPLAPWGFPETISLNGANGPQNGQDFVGIKLGDLNGSANPAQKPAQTAELRWQADDQTLRAGQTVALEFETQAFAHIVAYQFALRFDPEWLQLDSVACLSAIDMHPDDHFGLSEAQDGIVRIIWDDLDEHTLAPETGVFRLYFKALLDGAKIGDHCHIDENAMPAEAYNLDWVASPVTLVFNNANSQPTPPPAEALRLYQNRPNPFSERTTIGFFLPDACETAIHIYNAEGRLVYQHKASYTAGYHEIEPEFSTPAAGFFYYELVTPGGKLTRKMTKL